MSDEVRIRVFVSGRVQGVFFRDLIRRSAAERGVSGWVRNTPDGRVEAELQGGQRDVDDLVGICRAGPPQAEVTDIEVDHLGVVEGEAGFAIQ